MKLQELMQKRIPVLALVCALFFIVCVGTMILSRMNADVQALQTVLEDTRDTTASYMEELARLKEEKDQIDTRAYIQKKARELYGYMMPNEVHFIVTNPEALYVKNAEVELEVISQVNIQ